MIQKLNFTILLVALLSNCVTYREDLIKNYENPVSVEASVVKKVSYKSELITKAYSNGTETDYFMKNRSEREVQLNRIIEESNIFVPVSPNTTTSDYTIVVKLTEKGEMNQGLAFLFGFTGGLIPFFSTTSYESEMEIKNKAGKSLGKIERKESIKGIFQLFLIFVGPFNGTGNRYEAVHSDLFRSSMEEAIEKKYFGNYTLAPRKK